MSKRRTGLVIGKDFDPPAGAPPRDWCYLTVEIAEDTRIKLRLKRDQVNKADVGDIISFRQPKRVDDPASRLTRLASDPGLLPPVN